ncbi:MAG: hypothetical protein IPK69_06920 [Phycisphaerales bacterium]|nr:MAG: hypothetical protein IPK69_06920 [Phycisphaerales bacterium]
MRDITFKRTVCALAIVVASFVAMPVLAQPLTTRFTYQGRLDVSGSPASGLYDMRFGLYNAPVGGTIQGTTLCVDNLTVAADGTFAVGLDFGDVFDGNERYLQIDVRTDTGLTCSTASGFTALSRQRLTATPYASRSIVSGTSLKPWTPLGTTGARFDGTFVGINASTPVTSNGVFQVSRLGGGAGGFGGMWVTTDNATGRPFYGYNNTTGSTLAYHWLDGSDNSWRLFVGTTTAMTVTDLGFVGLGTTSPTQRLHVAGNVLATGNATFNGNVVLGGTLTVPTTTRYYSLGISEFAPSSSGTGFIRGLNDIQATGSGGSFRAQLHLPHGAIILDATAYFWDDSTSNDLVFILDRVDHNGPTTTVTVFTPTVQGFGALQSRTFDFADQVVNEQVYSFHVSAGWVTDGGNRMGLRSVVFRYTVTTPMP